MLFLTCTIQSENPSAGQMFPLGTTVKDKALLSNHALIYLPPCSLGPTVGLGRYFLVLVWSSNREEAACLTVHSHADDLNNRKLSHFLLLNTFNFVRMTGPERKNDKKIVHFPEVQAEKAVCRMKCSLYTISFQERCRIKYYSMVQYYHQEAFPLWKHQLQQLMICDIVL